MLPSFFDQNNRNKDRKWGGDHTQMLAALTTENFALPGFVPVISADIRGIEATAPTKLISGNIRKEKLT